MPEYIRAFAPGAAFFFTLVTFNRRQLFHDPTARRILRESIAETRRRRPFDIDAIVLLPDHLHAIWTLPRGDHDFSTRWRKIKESFTRALLSGGGSEAAISIGQEKKGLRGVWQPRFWEHTIRDEDDFRRHVDYIHYNPVKHGHAQCPHAWAFSSFRRWVEKRVYEVTWCCSCRKRPIDVPDFKDIAGGAGE